MNEIGHQASKTPRTGCFNEVVASIANALRAWESFVSQHFGVRFLTKSAFAAVLLSAALLIGGYYWLQQARSVGDDVLNGIVLMIVGALTAASIMIYNVRRTNLVVGAGGTLVQIFAFSVAAYLGLAVLVLFFFAAVIRGMAGRR